MLLRLDSYDLPLFSATKYIDDQPLAFGGCHVVFLVEGHFNLLEMCIISIQ